MVGARFALLLSGCLRLALGLVARGYRSLLTGATTVPLVFSSLDALHLRLRMLAQQVL